MLVRDGRWRCFCLRNNCIRSGYWVKTAQSITNLKFFSSNQTAGSQLVYYRKCITIWNVCISSTELGLSFTGLGAWIGNIVVAQSISWSPTECVLLRNFCNSSSQPGTSFTGLEARIIPFAVFMLFWNFFWYTKACSQLVSYRRCICLGSMFPLQQTKLMPL